MGVDWETLKHRFLEMDQSAQLNSLALNLIRIQGVASSGTGESVFEYLVRESQFFIEWIVTELDLEEDLDRAVELADLQRLLSRWKLGDWWGDVEKRQEMTRLAGDWGGRIVGRDGLSGQES